MLFCVRLVVLLLLLLCPSLIDDETHGHRQNGPNSSSNLGSGGFYACVVFQL